MDITSIFMDELNKVAYEGVSLSRRLGKDSPVRGELADVLKEQRARHPAQGRITYAGLRGSTESDMLPKAAVQAKKELGRSKLLAGASDDSMARLKAVASHAPKSSWGRVAKIGVPAAGAAAAGTLLAHHLLTRKRKEDRE